MHVRYYTSLERFDFTVSCVSGGNYKAWIKKEAMKNAVAGSFMSWDKWSILQIKGHWID